MSQMTYIKPVEANILNAVLVCRLALLRSEMWQSATVGRINK